MIRLPTKSESDGRTRSGVSLIEATMAMALTALLMVPVVGLLKTNRELWQRTNNDRSSINAVYGTLRHVSRMLRTAESILVMESRSGKPSQLQIRTVGGQVLTWKHDPRSGQVEFQTPAGTGILADHIDELKFEGLTSNGKVATDLPGIRSVRCTANINLKRSTNAVRSSQCTVWIRPRI